MPTARPRQDGSDATIEIRVQPRAARDEIAGERGGRLLVRVTAPPLDGRANAAACAAIAKALGIPRRRVTVIRGHSSRDKVVRAAGVDPELARAALARAGRR